MTHGKKQTRQEAAEQFIQLIDKLTKLAQEPNTTVKSAAIDETKRNMRQALGRVLCFELPDPQPSKIPSAQTAVAIEEAKQITEPRFKTSGELLENLEKEAKKTINERA